MPIAAENHTLAAVVILLTIPPLSFRIMPAPRKPMPVTIPAAIEPGVFGSIVLEIKVNIAAPPITKDCVLMPPGLPLDSLSMPMKNPANSASAMSRTKVYSWDEKDIMIN